MSAEPISRADALSDSAEIRSEQPEDSDLIEALLDRAFGPGRFVKSSERVREIAEFAPELSFCAWRDGHLLGVVRQWRARVGETPVVFLGPLAVDHQQRSAGVGGLLVERACEAARAAGEHAILLVGDPAYFGRFGFEPELGAHARMPGPVDQRRVQACAFSEAGRALAGAVRGPGN